MKLMIVFFTLLVFATLYADDGTVKMVYPHGTNGFSFNTHQNKKDGKEIRYLVEKGNNPEKFEMLYLTVLHAQATGYRLWISNSDYKYEQHGNPAAKCYGLSVSK